VTFSPDIAQVRRWVADAGQVALRYFGNTTPEWKGVANPVTEADRAIEQLLSERIREAYPDHGILGEEYGSNTLDHEIVWIIDPIDGTWVYVAGLPSWCITLAVMQGRDLVFGLVYLPLYDDWTYTNGNDVICNNHSIRAQLARTWREDSFVMARSDIGGMYNVHFTRIMTMGSSASHLAYTARGSATATIDYAPYLWDIAGGLAILRKQGGDLWTNAGPFDLAAMPDLTQRLDGLTLAGHPDVLARLLPLVHDREAALTHPAW
jgi:myo-inositol-1(or 4)-monophosphatase